MREGQVCELERKMSAICEPSDTWNKYFHLVVRLTTLLYFLWCLQTPDAFASILVVVQLRENERY